MLILFCAGDGIIPARAGFTYKELSLSDFCVGSSPLARGLLTAIVHPEERPRIIPARAGFTHRLPGPPRRGQDHPRSRGVYPAGSHCGAWPWGSSPLARGLPQGASGVVLGGRIIPARAGFTSNGCPTTPRPGDHPRSRGVYRAPRRSHPGCAGSSPLARGLPGYKGWRVIVMGIIPARAGFTRRRVTLTGDFRDHPRSRGVYVTHTMFRLPETGSSPLARGLLLTLIPDLADRRIIPARAGFTPPGHHCRGRRWDHPRSRGVYGPPRPGPRGGPGSSPLARGLRLTRGAAGASEGIIPARAGFTAVPAQHRAGPADHPRSRGVYRAAASA